MSIGKLDVLPRDVAGIILNLMDMSSLICLSHTCRGFATFPLMSTAWMNLLSRDFEMAFRRMTPHKRSNREFREVYKNEYSSSRKLPTTTNSTSAPMSLPHVPPDVAKLLTANDKWACALCTYFNNWSSAACEVCGSPKA